MKTNFKRLSIVMAFATMGFGAAMADETESDFSVDVNSDVVSSYIWRGQYCGGVSIQPALSVGWKGLSLSAWGSYGFEAGDTKEFDLTLGYGIAGFSVSVTDYYFAGPGAAAKYFKFAKGETPHVLEAQVGYDFGFLSLNWYTNFAGDDGVRNDEGDKAYSSYFTIGAPFEFGSIEWEAEVGFMPWKTSYYADVDGFACSNISLKATKPIKLSEEYSLGLFSQVVWNPAAEGGYIVMGLSF